MAESAPSKSPFAIRYFGVSCRITILVKIIDITQNISGKPRYTLQYYEVRSSSLVCGSQALAVATQMLSTKVASKMKVVKKVS